MSDNEETKTYKKQEAFFTAQMLKILGICYAVGAPWFVWATVTIFSLQGEVALVKQKQESIFEIKEELKEMRKDINQIKIDLSYMKRNP